jgi:hypothetical protein
MSRHSLFSLREKLLLSLLSATLIFSASWSYGAVDTSKAQEIFDRIVKSA